MIDSAAPSQSFLKKTLDRFYLEYDFEGRLMHDPIEFPHRYRNPGDIEVAGFVSSCLAYGRVGLFKEVLERLFSKMGESPRDFLLRLDLKRARKDFGGIKYRFNENDDILCLFFILREVLKRYSSIEKAFMEHYGPGDPDTGRGLSGLIGTFLGVDTSPVYGRNIRPAGYLQFFPSPAAGSACKRANLFLRWMTRDKDIDFGIWKGVPKDRLVIPLDTHIARISRCLGFTKRKSQDWKMAVEITGALRQLDPEDPLKYDFALCHHGISGMCRGQADPGCRNCVLGGRHR